VQKLHRITKLIRDVAHLIHWIRLVVVVFQEVKNAQTEYLKSDTCVTMEVEPV
jgi:hypothetical protein